MSAMDVVVMGLQAAESDALKQGAVPGYTLMAHGALEGLKYAGYAVVELPKPDHVAEHSGEVDAAWSTYPDGDPSNDARWPGPYRVAVDGDEIELGGNNLLPDEARALASALLAAAEMATSAEATS